MSEPRLSDGEKAQIREGHGTHRRMQELGVRALDEIDFLRARVAALEDMAARMARDDPTGARDAGAAQERDGCLQALSEYVAGLRNARQTADAVWRCIRLIEARGPCLPDLPEVAELERLRRIEAAAREAVLWESPHNLDVLRRAIGVRAH